jgi:hypothetical protein
MLFETASVKELTSVASVLKIKGRSKMDKAQLLAAVTDVIDEAHDAANLADVTLEIVEFAVNFLPETVGTVVTEAELLTITGWKRLPRKYKKHHRKAGNLA